MSFIPVEKFIENVKYIASTKPDYKKGHDGSTGYCDNMGLVRGALIRSGAVGIRHMKESNQCARMCVEGLHSVSAGVKLGEVVFQVRGMDDKSMPLPLPFQENGELYNGDLTNYAVIGVVTHVKPLEIIWMDKNIKRTRFLGKWSLAGYLTYVENPENKSLPIVVSNSGSVRMMNIPSFKTEDYIEIPNHSHVDVITIESPWAYIAYNKSYGYVLERFIKNYNPKQKDFSLSNEDKEVLLKAYKIIGRLLLLKGSDNDE